MPHDPPRPPPVSPRAILAALAEVQRRGHWPLFQQLECDEPDLAEHVLEQVSQVHQTLLDSGAPAKVVRRLQRQVQSLVLVTVLSVRATRSPRYAKDSAPEIPAPEEEL